jgi:SAM-dependent methyltransferase
MSLPSYSQRHLDPDLAAAYAGKFERNLFRRLSNRREAKIVAAALDAGLTWWRAQALPVDDVTLLDCPCGAGRFAAMAAGRVAHYIAGDHSPHMVALTKAVLQDAAMDDRLRECVTGDARHLPMADKSVDITLSMRLLHHFAERADRVQILSDLHRITRGPLVTSFLDAESWKQRRHIARVTRSGRNSRRVLLSLADFAAEAQVAGWRVQQSWPLSSVFSGQRVALCVPVSGGAQRELGAAR